MEQMGISVTYVTIWALSEALDKSICSGGHLEGTMSKILNSQSSIEHSVLQIELQKCPQQKLETS